METQWKYGRNSLKGNSTARTAGGEKRIEVMKTYKLFIGGKFPRTESGRYYVATDEKGKPLANMCRASRKDFRDSVVAARQAFAGWSSMSAMNRGQILYRLAEMVEGRKEQFVSELVSQGDKTNAAKIEVEKAIDGLVYYAGWCDKFQQIFSTVNPVASPHFNFSRPEPTGVVAVIAPEEPAFFGLISAVAPVIAGGNTVIVLTSEKKPLTAITFAEAVHTSDVPSGVLNILTGFRDELYPHFSSHMDVNGIIYYGKDQKMISEIQKNAALNVKRAIIRKNNAEQNPYLIMDTQEVKTTWHPVGV